MAANITYWFWITGRSFGWPCAFGGWAGALLRHNQFELLKKFEFDPPVSKPGRSSTVHKIETHHKNHFWKLIFFQETTTHGSGNGQQWAKKSKKTLWRNALGFLFWTQNFYLLTTSWVSLDLSIWSLWQPPLLCCCSSLKLQIWATDNNYTHTFVPPLYGMLMFASLSIVILLVPFLIVICI